MSNGNVMNRWWVVVGAVLIQLSLGAIYAWSVFTPPLKEAGWTKLETQIVFSVGLAVFAIIMVWAGKQLSSWGPRKMAVGSGLVLGLGYVMAGVLDATNFTSLVVFIGVIGGTGIGLGYVVPITVGMRWFPDKKGLITGLAVAGFGFGAMGWVKLAGEWGYLLQNLGLAKTFIAYGITFAVLILIGSIWMVFPPEGWKPAGYTPPAPAPAPVGRRLVGGLVGSQLLGAAQFYLIFITFVFSAGAGLMVIGLMKLYPMEALTRGGMGVAEASAISGTAMAVFFSLANGVGRIAWGSLSDKLGRKRSIVIMAASQGVLVLAFTFLAGHKSLLYLGASLIGFNFGGNFALFPTMTADVFGAKNVGRNYPYVFLAYGVGGIFGPILGGQLGDMGTFPLAFTICGVLCIIGATLTALVRVPTAA